MSYEKIFRENLESFRPSGNGMARARCPFHKGGAPSLRVNIETGRFRCYSGRCTVQYGGIVKFLTELGYDKEAAKAVADEEGATWRPTTTDISFKMSQNQNLLEEEQLVPEEYMAPFKRAPNFLLDAGFEKSTLQQYGIGWDHINGIGLFPVRDFYGNLAAVVGRDPGGDPNAKGPKYMPYYHRIKEIFEDYYAQPNPKKHVYNAHRAKKLWPAYHDDRWFIVVEGYKACMWVEQAGFSNVVALQGSYVSGSQIQALKTLGGFMVLFLDGDEGGRNGSFYVGKQLLEHMSVRSLGIVDYPDYMYEGYEEGDGPSPDDLTPDEIGSILSSPQLFSRWRLNNAPKKKTQSAPRYR
jgi:DNA primase